jgi:putative aldouronate transport system substrate-binding protein
VKDICWGGLKMKKSYWGVLAVTLILIGLLAGCRRNTAAAASEGSGLNFTGYPMNAKDKTITWFVSNGYVPNQVYATADQSPFHSGLEEMLGVNIEWIFPTAGTDSTQAFNLMMASDTLPDIFYHDIMSDAERYINEGTIRDLSGHIKEWSPAYYAFLQTSDAYDRSMKTDSGKYYGYGFFREDGSRTDTYLGPVVNKAWLDECGLPLPVTISDWDKTIRAFKDRYGAVLSFAWSRVSGYSTFLSGAFGAYSFADYRLYVDKNNKIQLANVQPEYRTELTKMNEWWRAGLIDQDVLSINDTMARSNALNKKMGISFTSMGQLSNWITDSRNANNGADWVGLSYAKGEDGTLAMIAGGYGIGNQAAAISTSCPDDKLELVMRALDYAYTEEGNLYWNFGKKGVSWDYDANGNPAYLPLVTNDPDGLNNATDKYGGTTWSGSCIQARLLNYMKNTEEAVAANDLWFYPNADISAKWTLPNGLSMSPDDSIRAADLRNTISTYVNEAAVQFISGQTSLSQWDSYVSRVNSMGLPELLSIYQAAYDRYLAR